MPRNPNNPRTCPHCGKPISLPEKPRDLGLLLHALCYRVPVHVEKITPEIIEVARKHCKMPSERLRKLQGPDYARFWDYMEGRRKRRREFMKETGQVPPYGWTPPKEGDLDNSAGLVALHLHRFLAAKVKAQAKRNPGKIDQIIQHAYERALKIRDQDRKFQEMNRVLQMIALGAKAKAGDSITTEEAFDMYLTLGTGRPNRRRRREARERKREAEAKRDGAGAGSGKEAGDQGGGENGDQAGNDHGPGDG